MEYKTPEYDYDYDQQQGYENPKNKSEMGLKIAIIVLFVVLIAVSFLYWRSVQRDKADKALMQVEMDTLQSRTERLMVDLDGLTFDNDTLNRNLLSERHKADSLMDRLKKERQMSYAKLKQYERELGTLRVAMQGFVRQIDSLNRVNQKLVKQNIADKIIIAELTRKTDVAEEKAVELSQKVARGSQIKAGKVTVKALNKNNKDARNAKTTVRLVVSFELAANELSEPGERNVYVRIVSPEGYTLAETQGAMFDLEGQATPYSAVRTVDYQGDNLPVSVFYNGSGLTSGTYTVNAYMDGVVIGTTTIILK